jgi:hypothetical protein
MTDEELQEYADQNVRLITAGRTVIGKLITGTRAQVAVQAPYAVQWHDRNPTLGAKEERLVAIPSAEAVESIELINEDVAAEIQDVAEDAQTPG